MIKFIKKSYEKGTPPLQKYDDETVLDEQGFRNIYKSPETQEKLFSLFYGEKKVEGLKEFFKLLELNVLDQNEIISLDDQPPKKQEILAPKKTEVLEKIFDALVPKKIDC